MVDRKKELEFYLLTFDTDTEKEIISFTKGDVKQILKNVDNDIDFIRIVKNKYLIELKWYNEFQGWGVYSFHPIKILGGGL